MECDEGGWGSKMQRKKQKKRRKEEKGRERGVAPKGGSESNERSECFLFYYKIP